VEFAKVLEPLLVDIEKRWIMDELNGPDHAEHRKTAALFCQLPVPHYWLSCGLPVDLVHKAMLRVAFFSCGARDPPAKEQLPASPR
jgi:hypothetical protein